MIGMIHRENGDLASAIESFVRGTKARMRTPEQELALTYEIGDCYEAAGQTEQALHYFQRASRMSASYDDPRGAVGERIRALDPGVHAQPAARAVGDGVVDEFDAALDDLMGQKLN
jgi:tetratricopeptide (TPR) repeat protein